MSENIYWAFSVAAVLIAALYFKVWPKPLNLAHARARPLVLHWVLRYGHSFVWLLLALFFIGKTGRLGQSPDFWQPIGLAAFCSYGVFLAACIYDRNKVRSS
jgi:hypothetical protein